MKVETKNWNDSYYKKYKFFQDKEESWAIIGLGITMVTFITLFPIIYVSSVIFMWLPFFIILFTKVNYYTKKLNQLTLENNEMNRIMRKFEEKVKI